MDSEQRLLSAQQLLCDIDATAAFHDGSVSFPGYLFEQLMETLDIKFEKHYTS